MGEKELMRRIEGSGVSPYTLISAMIANADSKLTAEEKAERNERRRLAEEERIRQSLVIRNVCPDCEGKLLRGKKDKKNDYKRLWTCKDCGSSHTA